LDKAFDPEVYLQKINKQNYSTTNIEEDDEEDSSEELLSEDDVSF
jgi:hypothetical protein